MSFLLNLPENEPQPLQTYHSGRAIEAEMSNFGRKYSN
jgi:hypothetical protein